MRALGLVRGCPSGTMTVRKWGGNRSASTAACSVGYKANSWTGGFTADVTVKNTGTAAISGWTLKWTFPGDQKITSVWNAKATQTGTAVTATDLGYNGSLAPGASTGFGFQATYGSANPSPTAFTLNGATCTVA